MTMTTVKGFCRRFPPFISFCDQGWDSSTGWPMCNNGITVFLFCFVCFLFYFFFLFCLFSLLFSLCTGESSISVVLNNDTGQVSGHYSVSE